MKGLIRIKKLKLEAPPFKLRSEFETEKLLAKWRAVARKRQIQSLIDEKDIPIYPADILTYTVKERRQKLFKVVGLFIKHLFKQLKP